MKNRFQYQMFVLDLLKNIDYSSLGLDELVKNLTNDDFKPLKKESPDKWHFLNKKLD